MNPIDYLLEHTWVIWGTPILVREVVGNGFGLASAFLGMRRKIWAWPVGMIGNALLFTVFVGGIFDKPQEHDLWGQAARQVFFFAVSAYGWWRWLHIKRQGGAADGGAITPRWATANELRILILAGAVMMAVFIPTLKWLNSFGPVPDAWILTGSILATYGMARGLRRLLVDLDRRRRGRRPTPDPRGVLPECGALHRLRRLLRRRVRRLGGRRATTRAASRGRGDGAGHGRGEPCLTRFRCA